MKEKFVFVEDVQEVEILLRECAKISSKCGR